VKAGDVVQVRVVEVDVARKRIGLTMRKDSSDARESARERQQAQPGRGGKPGQNGSGAKTSAAPSRTASAPGASSSGNAFADALRGKFGK
jgi:uncharacterized protein